MLKCENFVIARGLEHGGSGTGMGMGMGMGTAWPPPAHYPRTEAVEAGQWLEIPITMYCLLAV